MKKIKLTSFIIVLAALISFGAFLYFTPKTQAENSSVLSGYAKIANANHILFSESDSGITGTGVEYDASGNLSGWAWSDDYGWIDFNSANIDLDTGEMSGTARVISLQNPNDHETTSDWANGIIFLSGNNGGDGNDSFSVTFNITTGDADVTNHWAWGGNVLGWIDFSNVKITPASVINGMCTSTHYNCAAGSLSTPLEGQNSWTWGCNGINGGTNATNCSEDKNIPNPNDPELNSTTTVDGLTTLTWNNASSCTILPTILPTVPPITGWIANTHLSSDSGSLGLTVLVSTVFQMDCGVDGIISTIVCVAGSQPPAGYSCKKPPIYIEH